MIYKNRLRFASEGGSVCFVELFIGDLLSVNVQAIQDTEEGFEWLGKVLVDADWEGLRMQIRGNVFACFGKSWAVLTCLGLIPVILFLGSVQRMAVGADDSADKPQADSKSAADDGQAASEKKNERPLELSLIHI